jgi:hypothetical protein
MTAESPIPATGLRASLRSVTAAGGVPYGYTITIWSSGTVSVDVLGLPDLGRILLFMTGAVLGFVALTAAAYGTLGHAPREALPGTLPVWAVGHWVSAGAAIVAVWAGDHAIGTAAAWPVAGFLATTVYFVITAAQTTLAARPPRNGARR